VDADDAPGIDFEADTLEFSLGSHRYPLSLTEEAVQPREIVSAQHEPGSGRVARKSCSFRGAL
jgi:hypothetical protein